MKSSLVGLFINTTFLAEKGIKNLLPKCCVKNPFIAKKYSKKYNKCVLFSYLLVFLPCM